MHEWDKDRATAGFQRAIDLQPEYAFVHQLHGVLCLPGVAAESDLERHGVRPGSSLKTLGHEETGLRI